jgi:hypothetical protein
MGFSIYHNQKPNQQAQRVSRTRLCNSLCGMSLEASASFRRHISYQQRKKTSLTLLFYTKMSTNVYAVETPQGPKPYFSRLSFIAHDFAHWGYRVTEHDLQSAYMREVRVRETKIKLSLRRPRLQEIWAQEVVRQRHVTRAAPDDTSLHRVCEMLHDFICALATQGGSEHPKRTSWDNPPCLEVRGTPLPTDPGLNLVTICMRLLCRVRHHRGERSDARNTVGDRVELEFRRHEWLGEHLRTALEKVGDSPGRWVKGPERVPMSLMVRVQMVVDVGGCVDSMDGSEDAVDPLPLYEDVEESPEYDGEGEGTRARGIICRRMRA